MKILNKTSNKYMLKLWVVLIELFKRLKRDKKEFKLKMKTL